MMNLTDKKLISKLLFPVLFLCLLISACDNVFNKPVISEQDDMVLVYFRSSNLSMRSVLPDISKNDLTSYKLYGAASVNQNQKEGLLAEFKNINNASTKIKPEIWNFTMEAYDSNGYLMFRGIRKNVNITAGYSEAVNFSLVPVYDHAGTALIIIELPDETFVDSVEITLEGETIDSPPEIENGIIRFFIEKDAGNYLVNFFLKDSEGRVLAVKTEVLVIRSRLQSVKTITLTDDDFNVPAAPINVKIDSVSTIKVNLSWDSVNIANSYNIYRSESADGIYKKINTIAVNETKFIDTSVTPDTAYLYRIRSINGDIEGLQSALLRVNTLSSIPANVQVISISTVSLNFAWDVVEEAIGYNIYRSDTEHGMYEKINTAVETETEFTDTGVLPDRDYYYKISAVFHDFEGLQSTPLSANTLSSVPANFKYTSVLATKINLVWNSVADASGYNIYRSNSVDGNYIKINTYIISDREFTDTNLSSSTAYYYKISSVFNDFEGLQSSPSLKVTTISSTISITFDFTDPAEFEPSLPKIPDIIQETKDICNITVISTGSGWSNYKWFLNSVELSGNTQGVRLLSNTSVEINWQLPVGYYELTVVAVKNNVPYSASAGFKVLNTVSY